MRLRKLSTLVATLALCAVGIAVAPPAFAADDDIVNIPDATLKAAINKQLSKYRPADKSITEGELKTITSVNLEGVTDLTGLDKATNLGWVDLSCKDTFSPDILANLNTIETVEVTCEDANSIISEAIGQWISSKVSALKLRFKAKCNDNVLSSIHASSSLKEVVLVFEYENQDNVNFQGLHNPNVKFDLYLGTGAKLPPSIIALDNIRKIELASHSDDIEPLFQLLGNNKGLEELNVRSAQTDEEDITNGYMQFGDDTTVLDLPNLKKLELEDFNVNLNMFKNSSKLESIKVITGSTNFFNERRAAKVKVTNDMFARMKNLREVKIWSLGFSDVDQCNIYDYSTLRKKMQGPQIQFQMHVEVQANRDGVFPIPYNTDFNGNPFILYGYRDNWNVALFHDFKNGFAAVTNYYTDKSGANPNLVTYLTVDKDREYLIGSLTVHMPNEFEKPLISSPVATDPSGDVAVDYYPDSAKSKFEGYKFPEYKRNWDECKALGAMVDDPVVTDGSGRAASVLSVDEGSRLPDSTDGSDGESHQVRLELKNVYGETVKHGAYYLWDRASGADKNRLDYLTLRLKPGDPANEGFVSEGEGQNIWIEPLALDTDGSRSSNLDKPAVYTAKVRSSKAGSPVLEAVYNDNVFTLAPTAVVPFGNPPTPVNPDPGTGGDSGNTPGTGGDDTGTTPGAGGNPGTGDTPGSNPDAGGAATGSGDASSTGGVAAPKAPTGAGLATTGFDGVRLLLVSSMLIVLGGVTLYRRRV